jgi:hypothetical protein
MTKDEIAKVLSDHAAWLRNDGGGRADLSRAVLRGADLSGAALERDLGSCAAGALIYHASTGRVPDFFASDDDARADIEACAAKVQP